jgi:hypothetical protein
MDVMQPQFADEDPVNPFDFWEGANFKLKIQQVAGYRNYDKSEFANASALSDDDEKLEGVYNRLYSLQDFLDPKNYKTYDELKAKLNAVLGQESMVMTTAESVSLDEPAPSRYEPVEASPGVTSNSVSETSDGEDDTLSYFQKLASGQ